MAPTQALLHRVMALMMFATVGLFPLDGRAADGGVDAGLAPDDAGPDGGPDAPDAGMQAPDAGPEPEPEPVWTCEPSYYNANDGCDCECGIPDPDCALSNPANPTVYGCPAGVGCSLDGYCEIPGCGDGALNPELEICDDGNTVAYDGCSPGCKPESGYSCTADPTNCIPVPAGWASNVGPYCSDGRYGDGAFCDCGCGVLDLDCADITAECDGLPLGCIPSDAVDIDGNLLWEQVSVVPDLTDNTRCIGNVCGDTWVVGTEECDDGNTAAGDLCDDQCVIETPTGWTCNPEYVLDAECDCGCGAVDPACPGLALDPADDCAFDECRGPQNVDPTDHTRCLDPVVDGPDAGPVNGPDAGDPAGPDAGDPDGGTDGDGDACSSTRVSSRALPASSALTLLLPLLIARRRRSRR